MEILFLTIFIGLGATLAFDLWGVFLKYAFKVPPSNICLIGRWLLYMPQGTFNHSNIGHAQRKSGECIVGWIAHYLVGVAFAMIFVAWIGGGWLLHPTLIPALVFGVITVLLPFFIMQPSFGLGIASSKTPHPAGARLRSLINHTLFGIGLYLFAEVAHWVLSS